MPEEDQELPAGAKWITWGLYNLCLLGLSVILLPIALAMLRDAGGWSLIRTLNDHAGNLLTALVALLALTVAYREYVARNSPLFSPNIRSDDMHFGDTYYDVEIVSHFDKVIHLETVFHRVHADAVTVHFARPTEILRPSERVCVLRIAVPKEANAQAPISIALTCIGRSAVSHGARSAMKLECTFPQRSPEGGLPAPIISYTFNPQSGLLSMLR